MKLLSTILVCLSSIFFFQNQYVKAEERTFFIKESKDLVAIQKLLNQKTQETSSSTVLNINTNVYLLEDTFHINQSNISIIAEPGTKLVLANNTNKPVIAIGSQEETPSYTIENISISGIEIDGNKDSQDSEYDTDKSWIRNNGIDIRAVNRLKIDNIVSSNNRSGGLVISWNSSDVYISNSKFDNNYYDGIAYYASERIYTYNTSMKNNNSAGISLDNNLSDCFFSNCIIDSNQDVGIFVRYSRELKFNNCTIKNSLSWAVFLGHNENENGVDDTMFSCCHILNNNGGIFLSSTNNTQSTYISIVSSVFRANEQNDRLNIQTSGSTIWESANIFME